jgi:hypothetical protein
MQKLKVWALLALAGVALAGCVVHPRGGYIDHGRRWGWHDRGDHHDHGRDRPQRHWRRW